MKKQCLIIALVLISCKALSQSEDPHVVNAGAGEMESEDLTINYYVGDFIGYDGSDEYLPLMELKELQVYPNPVKTKLNLRSSIPDLDRVHICQVNGTMLYEVPISDNEVDFTKLPDGVYVLKIINISNEEVGSAKIVKHK